MTEEEFQGRVLRQLAAIVARLDEQDNAHDILVQKVDRLSMKADRIGVEVGSLATALEQGLNSITTLSRRVTRLENPNSET